MEPINRKQLKENAKIALKGNFWMIMLVALVANFLGAGFNGINGGNNGGVSGFNSAYNANNNNQSTSKEDIKDTLEKAFPGSQTDYGNDATDKISEAFNTVGQGAEIGSILILIGVILILVVVIYLLVTCISFAIGSFLGAPVTVGYYRFFMKNRNQEGEFTDLFSVFNKEQYMKVVKSMFSTNIRNWAWSLLFYFPGLVKAYEYYFVPYIMAENPDMAPERAREISSKLTYGHKWQIFILELSFIGWTMLFIVEEVFLGLISCGILAIPGILLVYPLKGYQMTTYAELYAERREYAIANGIATRSELKGFGSMVYADTAMEIMPKADAFTETSDGTDNQA